MIPAVVICAMVQFTPGSPRWYLAKNCHREAYLSSCQLRYKKVQAARDLFHMDTLLQAEKEAVTIGQSKIKEILTMGRNRNAMLNSEVGMFMQQLCGVNAIACYSTEILKNATGSNITALSTSLGFGAIR